MRFLLIPLLFLTIESYSQAPLTNLNKVDSVIKKHYQFLKRQVSRRSAEDFLKTSSDTLQLYVAAENEAIEFFESITGIKSKINHNYALSKDYDMKLVNRWYDWLVRNRKKLQWDNSSATIVKVP